MARRVSQTSGAHMRFSFPADMHPSRVHCKKAPAYGQMSIRCKQTPLSTMIFLLLGLEVVEEDGSLLGLLTPILDNNARAVDNLACVSLTVQHT